VGFAGGIERIVEQMKKQEVQIPPCFISEVFLIQLGEFARRKSLPILFKLFKEGFKVNMALDKESLRSQLKVADKLKVPFALILGQKEARDGTIIVRNMLDGSQETIEIKKLFEFLKKRIGGVVKVKKHK
jgi:histidyl-tRNA synthetase